jgi:hypothetical protein
MLMFLNTITNISLLKDSANNCKFKYISFYTDFLKRVKMDLKKCYNKCNLKSFKAFISYIYYFKRTSFPAPFYTL